MIPKYEGDGTSPFKSTDENRRFKLDKADFPEKPKFPPPPQPVFEMKVNDTIFNQKPQQQQQQIYPATYVPIPNPLHPTTLYNPPAVGFSWTPNNVPVIKKYNIAINNANGDLTRIAEIFEDILPPSAIAQNRYTTLSERLVINNYVRSMFITRGDNEEVHMTGDRDRKTFELSNLMSRLKFMDINPYHVNYLTANVYRTLPKNMVTFRTCYPVRFHSENNQVKCAKDSISMHVRIYSLSLFDKFVTAGLSDNLKKTLSDVWREIMYYDKIKEDVIKKKVSPNFVTMYGYFKTKNSGVNFQKLEELSKNLKNMHFSRDQAVKTVKDAVFHQEVVTKFKQIAEHLAVAWNQGRAPIDNTAFQNGVDNLHLITDNKDGISKVNSELCVVALTEGPTQNILNWATKTYQIDGPVRKQIQSGIYSVNIWKSIIFQLLTSMIVLENQKIAFRNFSLQNNVFIKDLNVETGNSGNNGYWKYRVKGIDFYVPNYGYLLMIDSSFPDFTMDENDAQKDEKFKEEHIKQIMHYKVYGEMYGDKAYGGAIDLAKADTDLATAKAAYDAAKAAYDAAKTDATYKDLMNATKALDKDIYVNIDYEERMRENRAKIFDADEFSKAFQLLGGVVPPSEVLDLLKAIKSMINQNKKLEDILLENIDAWFKEYIHNKVGDLLMEDEKQMLQPHTKDFVKGELVAYEIGPENYKWSVYMDKNTATTNGHHVLTKDTNGIVTKVPVTEDLINRIYGTVKQKYDINQKRTDEDLMDTYTIS